MFCHIHNQQLLMTGGFNNLSAVSICFCIILYILYYELTSVNHEMSQAGVISFLLLEVVSKVMSFIWTICVGWCEQKFRNVVILIFHVWFILHRSGEKDECHLHYQYCKKAWMFYILASWRYHWGSLESVLLCCCSHLLSFSPSTLVLN